MLGRAVLIVRSPQKQSAIAIPSWFVGEVLTILAVVPGNRRTYEPRQLDLPARNLPMNVRGRTDSIQQSPEEPFRWLRGAYDLDLHPCLTTVLLHDRLPLPCVISGERSHVYVESHLQPPNVPGSAARTARREHEN